MKTFTITVQITAPNLAWAKQAASEMENSLQDAADCGELPDSVSWDIDEPVEVAS